ncbi:MAG: hypothetical protein NUW22_09610, partial [Acidobacteria bacterium]|nr:hypothetical protein [Acidobacteriota bacterium]
MTNPFRSLGHAAIAVVAVGLVVMAPLAARTETQKAPGAVPAAADTATVAHVLSRLAYGPR